MSTTTTPVTGAIAEGTGTGALADDISVDGRTYHLEIFLISMAGLLLEIAYTRVISFKLFYYYTYLIIGLALLGVGFGGVLVAVSERLRRLSTDTILLWGSLIGVASVVVGYLVVAVTPINTLLTVGLRLSGVVQQPGPAAPHLPRALRAVRFDRRDDRHAVRPAQQPARPPLLRRPAGCRASPVRRPSS